MFSSRFLCLFFSLTLFSLVAEEQNSKMFCGEEPSLSVSSQEMNSSSCEPASCYSPYFTADFIFWKSSLDGLSFAQSGLGISSTQSASQNGKIENIHFDYTPGLKVGAGLVLSSQTNWDLYAQYSWLSEQTDQRQVASPSDTLLFNTWFAAFPGVISTVIAATLPQVTEKWHQHFNAIDLEFGKQCFLNSRLVLNPYAGFKAAFVEQALDLNYSIVLNGALVTPSYLIRAKQNFSGIGIRAGCHSSWTIYKKLGVTADIAAAALWSYYDTKRKDVFPDGADLTPIFPIPLVYPSGFITYNSRSKFTQVTPITELKIGLHYQIGAADQRRLILTAAWEEQVWWDVNQFIDEIFIHKGNLWMQGLTASVSCLF